MKTKIILERSEKKGGNLTLANYDFILSLPINSEYTNYVFYEGRNYQITNTVWCIATQTLIINVAE